MYSLSIFVLIYVITLSKLRVSRAENNLTEIMDPKQTECAERFGCEKNKCWISCNNSLPLFKPWCFASETGEKIAPCDKKEDCNNCWVCAIGCYLFRNGALYPSE